MHVQCSYLVVLCFSSSNYLFHQNLEAVECSINKYTNDVINPFLTKSKFATNLKNNFFFDLTLKQFQEIRTLIVLIGIDVTALLAVVLCVFVCACMRVCVCVRVSHYMHICFRDVNTVMEITYWDI